MSEYNDHPHRDLYGEFNSDYYSTDTSFQSNDYSNQQYSLHPDNQDVIPPQQYNHSGKVPGYGSNHHRHQLHHSFSDLSFESGLPANPYYYGNLEMNPDDYYVKHDDTTKRKLHEEKETKRKEPVRPMRPVRQQSNPNMPKRSARPLLNKSLSYNLESNPKSLFEFNKRKPNFYLNLDHLKNPSIQSFDSSNSQAGTPGTSNGLYIQDADLQFDNEFDITPSMKPPGTNENEYFDDLAIPTNFQSSDLTGFDFDIYDKNYYTNDDHQENNDNNDQNKNYLEYQMYPEILVDEYHIDTDDKKSPPTPLSNSPSRSPALYKTLSNQSNSSVTSGSSAKDTVMKKKKLPKGSTCSICGKYISRDLSRHLRIHDEVGRFRCVFPEYCNHKTGKFNRPYDYKKHLLHFHFVFDNKSGKTANNLTEKLPLVGNCKHCNYRTTAQDWLENHVLTVSPDKKCKYATGIPNPPH